MAIRKMHLRKILVFAAAIFAATACMGQTKGSTQTKATVYVFGVGDSMRDSTVYITSVQCIPQANVQKRTKFLLDRPYFSLQLKNHFSRSLGDPNRLCIIYYFKSEKDALKKMMKARSAYLDEGKQVKPVSAEEFSFSPMDNAVFGSTPEEAGSTSADNSGEE